MRGLFINSRKAKDSIYESGYMAYKCLLLSNKYGLDYTEIDIDKRDIAKGYDFYFFNFHPATMGWFDTGPIKKDLGFCITMILEVAPDDPFVMCSDRDFDAYIVLDPTIKIKNKNVYAFPRPLEKIDFDLPELHNEIPMIGTFGFATKGKGFQHVVEAVNKEFDKAIVRISIPYGDFVPHSKEYASFLAGVCRQRAKEGIEVRITHDFMSKKELISWCASNTLNCFLYDRNIQGLAATTDQAIVANRPLSVSDNDTFRHITAYLKPYPVFSLKDSIERSLPIVKQMQQDWTPENFAKKFEQVLSENAVLIKQKKVDEKIRFLLPLKKETIFDLIENRYKKYKRKLRKITLSNILRYNGPKHSKKVI